jgi:hypothetical protein
MLQAGSQRSSGGEEPRAASHHGVQHGRSVMTPEGHQARSDPGHIVGPNKAVVLMRSARVFQGPDTCVVHQEAGYRDTALY